MKRIDHAGYLALQDGARVLESDGHGLKVLALADGTLVKVFRRKRWLSTALLYPYARRFVSNTRRLTALGIPTVRVLGMAYCAEISSHLVTYQPLPGQTLREALGEAGADRETLLAGFAAFVARLHQQGVYFRSLHFGNVIVPAGGGPPGLIDVADLGCSAGPLPLRKRVRNFRHVMRYRQDRTALFDYGWEKFLGQYLAAAGLAPRAARTLAERLHAELASCARG